jgi:hypothetical protein
MGNKDDLSSKTEKVVLLLLQTLQVVLSLLQLLRDW